LEISEKSILFHRRLSKWTGQAFIGRRRNRAGNSKRGRPQNSKMGCASLRLDVPSSLVMVEFVSVGLPMFCQKAPHVLLQSIASRLIAHDAQLLGCNRSQQDLSVRFGHSRHVVPYVPLRERPIWGCCTLAHGRGNKSSLKNVLRRRFTCQRSNFRRKTGH
jgi:hypothetical protein